MALIDDYHLLTDSIGKLDEAMSYSLLRIFNTNRKTALNDCWE